MGSWRGRAAASCDLMLAVGTKLSVYPIAGVVPVAKRAGAAEIVARQAEIARHIRTREIPICQFDPRRGVAALARIVKHGHGLAGAPLAQNLACLVDDGHGLGVNAWRLDAKTKKGAGELVSGPLE